MVILWYFLIFLGTLIEGEIVLLIATYAITQGRLESLPVMISAGLGAYCGDLIVFELGRAKGDSLSRRFPKLSSISESVGKTLRKLGPLAVILIRFQIAMRTAGFFSIGRSRMRRSLFYFSDLCAAIAWAALLVPLCQLFFKIIGQIWSMAGG